MTGETLREAGLAADVDYIIDALGITDPELQRLTEDFIDQTVAIRQRIEDFADSLGMDEPGEPLVDRTVVDSVVTDVIGDQNNTEFKSFSRIFATLANSMSTKDDDEGDPLLLLHDGFVGCTVLADKDTSRYIRRRLGSQMRDAQSLGDFWNKTASPEEPSPLTDDRIEHIRATVLRPILDVKPRAPLEDNYDARAFREVAAEAIANISKIAGDVSLDGLKMVVATELVRVFGQKVLTEILATVDDTTQQVADSPFAAAYHASDFINELHKDDVEHVEKRMQEIYNLHFASTNGFLRTFINRPRSEFKAAHQRLATLGTLYREIESAEQELAMMEPKLEKGAKLYEDATRREISIIAADAAKLSGSMHASMVQRANQLMHETDDPDEKGRIWEEARAFDNLRCEVTASVASKLQELSVPILDSVWSYLTVLTERDVERQLDERNAKWELDSLKLEIDQRLERFDGLDGVYELTNTQLRKRDERLVSLSKILADSIKTEDHGSLSIETSRALTGLMLGVYTERTGSGRSPEELVRCYVKDSEELKTLSLELEFLGQPVKSKLLHMMHLLDELIDSGVFDNPDKDSGLDVFDDFLLAYMIATTPEAGGGQAEPTEIVEMSDDTADEKELPLPDVPVEAIGRAAYEDIRVFPPGSGEEEIIQDFLDGIGESDMPAIEWERITKLIQLRDQLAGQKLDVTLIRTRHASWQVLPFFVLEVKLPQSSRSVAVVESPVYGNATYIYREASERPAWREVVQLPRRDARELGAVAMVHVDGKRLDNHFVKIWNRVISDLTIYQ